VTILERAPREMRGGNSAFSGGIFRCAFRDFDEIRPILTESATLPFAKSEVEPYGADAFHNDLMRVTEGWPTATSPNSWWRTHCLRYRGWARWE